jgi:hypothetical protein
LHHLRIPFTPLKSARTVIIIATSRLVGMTQEAAFPIGLFDLVRCGMHGYVQHLIMRQTLLFPQFLGRIVKQTLGVTRPLCCGSNILTNFQIPKKCAKRTTDVLLRNIRPVLKTSLHACAKRDSNIGKIKQRGHNLLFHLLILGDDNLGLLSHDNKRPFSGTVNSLGT